MKRRRVISVPAKKRFTLPIARAREIGPIDEDCRKWEAAGWRLPKSMSVRENKADYSCTLRLTKTIEGEVGVRVTKDLAYTVRKEGGS